ncbi:queuosine precursor transporter [Haloarcula marina]|uniref:queuosine precursor transporter n=1 Tax=Haloarcula marina TaxID=2961574 RepID=UPI0020B78BDB|nr:queuosine precursor transporter [Halomicroarcula marina]
MSSSDDVVQVGLVALFVTALVVSQVTASKLLAFGLPFSLPVVGEALVLPGAALAYALTFFASDCYAELYGRRAATVVVNVGFAMNFVLLALVWSTILAPGLPAQAQPVDPAAFRNVLAASTGIVVASLAAYVVSQNLDVFIFHELRDRTDGEALWLRNVGSTATSQLVDTLIFIGIGFVAFQGVGLSAALSLVVGQYVLKLLIALLDTPFVYAVVRFASNREDDDAAAPAVQ